MTKYKALIEVEFEEYDNTRAMKEAQLIANVNYKTNGKVYTIAKYDDKYCFE